MTAAIVAGTERFMRDENTKNNFPPEIRFLRVLAASFGAYAASAMASNIQDPAARALISGAALLLCHRALESGVENETAQFVLETLRSALGTTSAFGAVEAAFAFVDKLSKPELGRPPKIFVSHSWAESESFFRLMAKVRGELELWDYSVHVEKAYGRIPDEELRRRLSDRIRAVDMVFVLAHRSALDSRWVAIEIELANQWKKPIIAIRPWGERDAPLDPLLESSVVGQVGFVASSVTKQIDTYAELAALARDQDD